MTATVRAIERLSKGIICVYIRDDSLVHNCAREGEEDSGGHVLWDTTSESESKRERE